ncbi:MAG: redoxin family protein [Pseudomonadota bacterium]
MNRWIYILPILVLALIGAITAFQLADPEKPGFAISELRPAPERAFPLLEDDGVIAFAPPPSGETSVVNLFASWCAPCRVEHPLLMQLAEDQPGQVYGLAYKDQPADTQAFLAELGDPYTAVGKDEDGRGGLDFGLTGVPETFVINSEGVVILHIRGPLEEDSLEAVRTALAQ